MLQMSRGRLEQGGGLLGLTWGCRGCLWIGVFPLFKERMAGAALETIGCFGEGAKVPREDTACSMA